jgi:hypothetical protein
VGVSNGMVFYAEDVNKFRLLLISPHSEIAYQQTLEVPIVLFACLQDALCEVHSMGVLFDP